MGSEITGGASGTLPDATAGTNGATTDTVSSAVPIFSWMADASGHVIALDSGAARFLGRPLTDELGDGWMQFVHPEDQAVLDRYRSAVAAGHSFSLEYRCRLAGGAYVWLQRTGAVQRASGSDGVVSGFTGICLDITEQKRIDTRARVLQALIAALSRAVTPRQVAQAIIDRGARPLQAHLVSVVLASDDDSQLQMVNPEALPDDLAPQYQVFQRDYHGPLTDVFRANEPIWIESQDDYIQRYPKVADHVRRTDTHASATFPLIIGDRAIGSLGISFPYARAFSASDRAFFTAIAHHCALALERARLYETERQLRRQAEHHASQLNRIQGVVTALSQAVTPHEVAGVILNQGREALEAAAGCIVVPTADGAMLDVVRTVGYPAEQRGQRLPIDLQVPLAVAVRTRQPLWLRTAAEGIDALGWREVTTRAIPGRSWVAIPLLIGERVLGALGFSFPTEHRFEADERGFILSLAYHCAQAMERARLFEAEAQARRAAEEANNLKLRFLAIVSHELRTPLASIKGFTSTLLAPDIQWDAERTREFLTIIDQESDKLTDLIEQLLDLSRVQAGTLRIQQKPHPLSAVLEIAAAQLHTLAASHALQIEGFETAPPVLVDAQRIAQVLVNLVDNAAKYSPPGTPIVVAASREQDHVRIDVRDSGDGIPPEAQPLIFEAFRRAGRSSGKGAGLGLAICKGVIEAHGGRIWIDDTRGSGTTICFTLSVAPPASTQQSS